TYMIGTFAFFGSFVFIAQYLQLVLGLSPLQAGLWSLPSFVSFVAGSMIVPMLARRFPPAQLICVGLVIMAIGFAVLSQVDRGNPLAVIVIGSLTSLPPASPVVYTA